MEEMNYIEHSEMSICEITKDEIRDYYEKIIVLLLIIVFLLCIIYFFLCIHKTKKCMIKICMLLLLFTKK